MLYILLALLLSLVSCRRSSHEPVVLLTTDTLMNLSPDSASRALEQFDSLFSRLSERERFLFTLHRLNTLYRTDQELAPHAQELDQVCAYFRKEGDDVNTGKAYLLKARMETEKENLAAAVSHFYSAIAQLEKKEKGLFLAMAYSDLGWILREQCLYDEAIEYSAKACKVYQAKGDVKGFILESNSLAYLYLYKEKASKAVNIYEPLLEQARLTNDTSLWASVLNKACMAYRAVGRQDKALQAIKLSAKLSLDIGEEPVFQTLALIYSECGYRDSAYKYLDKAVINENLAVKASTYSLLSEMKKQDGDLQSALRYAELYELYKDSLILATHTIETLRIDYQHRLAVESRQIKRKHRVWSLSACIAVAVLLTLGLVRYRNRRKKKQDTMLLYKQASAAHKEKIDTLCTEIQKLQHELFAWKELPIESAVACSDATALIESKEERLNLLESEVHNLRIKLFKSTPIGQRIAKEDEHARCKEPITLLKPTERNELFACLNNIFEADINFLVTELPSLTKDDLSFCCLSFCGFSTPTIAACFGYDDGQAVRQRKYRMKHKMSENTKCSFYYKRIFER